MKQDLSAQEILQAESATLGLDCSEEVVSRLVRYWELLCDSAALLNLISPAALEQGPLRHIGDSLLGLLSPVLAEESASLLDIGSGGGLPGLALAIARPRCRVVLVESRERKAEWLVRTVRTLELEGRVTVRCERFESLPPDELTGYDCLTARALAAPARTLDLVRSILGPDTSCLLWHSEKQAPEIAAALIDNRGGHILDLYWSHKHLFTSIGFSSVVSEMREAR